MAYTYEDFVTAANNAGMMNQFDSNDLDYAKKYPEYGLSMISLKRDLNNAKTNEQQLLATEAINQLRKNYGSYWTGDHGNRSYAASYGSKINDALDKINNYEPFSYDPETDELFSDYRKTYLREGDRAAANALAQAARATGGRVSSFAEQAAQQAGNYYAAKLADIIPQLRSQRYGEYQDGFNRLQQALTNYQTQDKTDYQRYLDMINAEYQRDRDAVADAQQELQNAITIYQLTGQATGALKDLLAAAGLLSTGSSGGGGGGGGGGSATTKTTSDSGGSSVAQSFADNYSKQAAADYAASHIIDAVSGAAPSTSAAQAAAQAAAAAAAAKYQADGQKRTAAASSGSGSSKSSGSSKASGTFVGGKAK